MSGGLFLKEYKDNDFRNTETLDRIVKDLAEIAEGNGKHGIDFKGEEDNTIVKEGASGDLPDDKSNNDEVFSFEGVLNKYLEATKQECNKRDRLLAFLSKYIDSQINVIYQAEKTENRYKKNSNIYIQSKYRTILKEFQTTKKAINNARMFLKNKLSEIKNNKKQIEYEISNMYLFNDTLKLMKEHWVYYFTYGKEYVTYMTEKDKSVNPKCDKHRSREVVAFPRQFNGIKKQIDKFKTNCFQITGFYNVNLCSEIETKEKERHYNGIAFNRKVRPQIIDGYRKSDRIEVFINDYYDSNKLSTNITKHITNLSSILDYALSLSKESKNSVC